MKRIVLHIGRLVLGGFGAEDRDVIAETLRSELANQLRVPGLAERLAVPSDRARMRLGRVVLAQAANPSSVGQGLAAHIGKGLKS